MTRPPRRLIAQVKVSALFLVLFTAIVAAQDVPYLTGRVVDDAHILSDGARAQLTSTLKAHEDATTNQVVVLTVPTLDGRDIESYANNVFHTRTPLSLPFCPSFHASAIRIPYCSIVSGCVVGTISTAS